MEDSQIIELFFARDQQAIKELDANAAIKRNSRYDVALSEVEREITAPDTVEDEAEVKALARLIEVFLDSLSTENRVIFMRRYWFSDSYVFHVLKDNSRTHNNLPIQPAYL